jgi:nucleoside-diphosphate-sugar epimerase
MTGASGYLGGALMDHFSQMPEVECVTGIGMSHPPASLPPRVKYLQMDIRSDKLPEVIAGHDTIVNAACVVLWSAKMPAAERDDINLNGTRNVARAALACNVRRFIHTSSMGAYDPALIAGQSNVTEDFTIGKGDSPYYYWNSKAGGERVVNEVLGSSSVLTTFFRPIYIIGARNRSIIKSYQKNALMFPGRNPRRQFIHEDDVAAAFVQALRTDLPGAYNLVPDDFIRLSDVWRIVGAKFIPTIPLPIASLITALRWRFMGSPIHSSWVKDMLLDFTGSNARLKGTGWKPRYGSAAALQTAL